MATPYSTVHEAFLNKISDYDILKLLTIDREQILDRFLISACTQFKRVCKIDLTDRDDTLRQFNSQLDDDTIEILAMGECFYWVNPKVLNTENLKNALNTKDFQQYSPANLLNQLQTLRNTLSKEFKQAIINYSYANADISKLKE